MANTHDSGTPYTVGAEVEVFNRYSQDWVSGFEIASIADHGYALRRQSDWAVLPGTFTNDDLRVAAETSQTPATMVRHRQQR